MLLPSLSEEWWGSVPPSFVVFSWALDEVGAKERFSCRQRLRLPWSYSVMQYYSTNVIRKYWYHRNSTLCRAHVFWTRRTGMLPLTSLAFLDLFVWASPGFVHSDDSSKKVFTFPLVPVQQGLYGCIAVPLLHIGNFMGYPTRCKFVVTQNVVQDIEHIFVTYSNFRCSFTRSPSAITIQEGSKELNYVVLHLGTFCTEVVLNDIPPFPKRFNPSYHCAIKKHCIATCFMQSLKIFLCTTISRDFNFNPGMLL